MKITADDEQLLVGDAAGHLTLISSIDGEVTKKFGRLHDGYISGMIVTLDQKFFFSASSAGELKQWNGQDLTLAKDHGEIMDPIYSLCL
jgi:hypothetical protein